MCAKEIPMKFVVPTHDGSQNVILDNIFNEDSLDGNWVSYTRGNVTIFSLTENAPHDAIAIPETKINVMLTYSKVTPESAEVGETAEHGFILPNGFEQPMKENMVGKKHDGYLQTGTLDDVMNLANVYNIFGDFSYGSGDDCHYLGSGDSQDFRSGATTQYNLFCDSADFNGVKLDPDKFLAVMATKLPFAKQENIELISDEAFEALKHVKTRTSSERTGLNELLAGDFDQHSLKDKELYDRLCHKLNYDGANLGRLAEHERTKELCWAAISLNGASLEFVPTNLKSQAMCKESVKSKPWAIRYVPQTQLTSELCMQAVKGDGKTLAIIPDKFKTPDLCMAAVKNTGFALEDVPEVATSYQAVKKASGELSLMP